MFSLKTKYYARLLWQNPWLLSCNSKVRNYARYKMLPHTEHMESTKKGPVFLSISITRRCNLSCSFCIVGDVINKPGWQDHEATIESVQRLLDHPVASQCLYTMLTGGEPLLNKNIVDFVRLIKARRHLVGITSNGILLKDKAEDLRAAGLDLVNISLYDTNIDALADILPDVSKQLYCKLCKLITEDDLAHPERIEDVVRFARETGVGRIFFQNVLPHVDSLASQRELPMFPQTTGEEAQPVWDDNDAYPEIQKEMAQKYPDVAISWPAALPRKRKPGPKRCRMPWYLLVTDVFGNMGFCCSHASCTGPNLFDLPVEKVMNTEPWLETRRGLLDRNGTIPRKCKGCYNLDDPWASDM